MEMMLDSLEYKNAGDKEVQRECDSCKERGETVIGSKFCLDCQEIYCKTCTEFHKKFKITKHHWLIDTNTKSSIDVVSRPSFFTSFTKCPNHPDGEAEIYCKDHDVVFCVDCFNNTHMLCNICIVSDHGNDVTKLSEYIDELTLQMINSHEYLNIIQTKIEEIKNNLGKKLNMTKDQIEHSQDQIVAPAYKVAASTVTQQIELNNEDILYEGLARVSGIKQLIEANVFLLDTISQHGSRRQQFIAAHLMKTQKAELDRKVLQEDERLKTIEAKWNVDDDYSVDVDAKWNITDDYNVDIEAKWNIADEYSVDVDAKLNIADDYNVDIEAKWNIADEYSVDVDAKLNIADDYSEFSDWADAEKLVQVAMNETESDLTRPDAVANYLRDSNFVQVEKHTVRPKAGNIPLFTGVSMYKDGRVILCDTISGYLCLYNPAKKTMLKLKLNNPRRATTIDDTRIAVSIPYDTSNNISIVSVGDELRVEKTFQTQKEPRSIVALNNGQLAVAWDDPPAFGVIDISGTDIVEKTYFDQDKSGRKFRSFTYLSLDEERQHVIQPCYRDEAVYCFDFTGEPVFKYTNPELTNPRGVALDNCGNIYVCDRTVPGNIHKLSPAGELISVIKKGVPSRPWAICSDVTGTGFWVTQWLSPDNVLYFQLE